MRVGIEALEVLSAIFYCNQASTNAIETKIQSRTEAIETRYTTPTTNQWENNQELLSKLIMKKQLVDQIEE